MCAECHSTGVRKNYDAANDRFATTWRKSASAARPVTARALATSLGPADSRAGGHWVRTRIRARGLWFASTNASDVTWPIDPKSGNAARSARLRRCARRWRPADCAMRAAASFRKTGCQDNGCRKRTGSHRSVGGSIMPMGRCSTRSTIMARSSRARCSLPALPAATATSRMAPSSGRRAKAFACNATRPTNMRRPHHRHEALCPTQRARPATCRHAPTWWSISGTTTAFAFRGPISP